MKKFFTPLSILSTILFLLIASFGYYIYTKVPKQLNLSKLETIKAKPQTTLTFIGIQQAEQTYTLYFTPKLGTISDILVKNEATITPHMPLLEYYNSNIEKRITAKKKTLSFIQQHQTDTKTPPLLQYELNQQIQELQSRLRTQIFSPIKGKVTLLDAFPSKSSTKVMVINSDRRVIRAMVSESELKHLKIKQNVNVTSNHSKLFTGKILYISPVPSKIAKKTSFYRVDITSDDQFPLGRHFDIDLGSGYFELPKSVIYNDHFILLIQNNKIIKRSVKYIKSQKNGYIMISDGINIGDKIIVHPTSSLLHNDK
nr:MULTISPECIES: HlyD family efflux transporter periplasmic adaptor subunit [unclassified Staphylococcus]